jgi:hypothetical protein
MANAVSPLNSVNEMKTHCLFALAMGQMPFLVYRESCPAFGQTLMETGWILGLMPAVID